MNESIYTIKTQISSSQKDEKLAQFRNIFGDYTEYQMKVSMYKHSRMIIQVNEELDGQQGVSNVITLGSYFKTKDPEKSVYLQHMVNSKITGNIHEFLQSIGENLERQWIEKGYAFKQDKMNIRIFSIFDENGHEKYSDTIGIVFESTSNYTDNQETICAALDRAYTSVLEGVPRYNPEAR
ncbi:hypothetical protein TVAG_467720 [Trichomonas vaginalis G3]|uniref:Mediator of RNA polymerase II transcription subunit 18 n=1 Tax=Trichomonas vaginalis (strain ATCC PRA-98 / G3) TaxID=412133 RepID=A2E0L2_TRIV3|nr:hypothetical protein TVAGG3_0074210 [Trichomonas vaginalis G3]EAY13757.1 hypothetical protein TVAG_467720 [Trichomonas vaginalis G3]KAI5542727.1 hypothetical protein TVAGG3_0074210 [Trichomonas vaginalis G3]|eukprot:XP_001325980.1 hypothetical protein [Trichomonas vaginalis G3]